MKWNLAACLLTVLVVEAREAPPADACGVKLTVKSSAPKKAIARTSNPSDVLLLGSPPRRLELDLEAAGHRVDVAPNAAAAKKKSYAVVVTDPDHESEARSSFSGATVIVRSGDVAADTRSVEKQVARKPLRADESRTPVAARPTRTPIATGGGNETRKVVAVKEPTPPPETIPPTVPPPEKVVPQPKPPEPKPVEAKPPEPKPVEVTPPPEPKPAKTVPKASGGPSEVYFGFNQEKVTGGSVASLNKTVRWLKDNTSISIVIEGHADPTGTPEANLALAQKRADWVRDYLVSAGIDASRIEVISYGDTHIKYGRSDGRNRRVAIVPK